MSGRSERFVSASVLFHAVCSAGTVMMLWGGQASPVQAAVQTDNWHVDGEYGELHVRGELTESACRLDMDSSFQLVDMRNNPVGRMLHPGDSGEPVAFQIRLLDCLSLPGGSHDNRTGGLVWSENQPVVSLAFLARENTDLNSIIHPENSSGIGLKLLNSQHQPIQLGRWGRPFIIEPGQDEMTFYIVPVRTQEPLIASTFRASLNFFLTYE